MKNELAASIPESYAANSFFIGSLVFRSQKANSLVRAGQRVLVLQAL